MANASKREAQTEPSTDQKLILAAKGNEKYTLTTRPSKKVRATYKYKLTAPSYSASEWLLYAMHPPELPGQMEVLFTMSPPGKKATESAALERSLWFAKLPVQEEKDKKHLECEFEIKAQLYSRKLESRGGGGKKGQTWLSPGERSEYLAPKIWRAHDSPEFGEWLNQAKLKILAQEGQIDFARRIFNHIVKDFRYEYLPGMDRKLMSICESGKSDCGGLSILFTSVLRANDIPARLLFGRRAVTGQASDTYQAHAKAEFFAEGVGWVPVDCSSAIVSGEGNFFGNDDGNFIAFHVNDDITVDVEEGRQLGIVWLQGFGYSARGEGSFDKSSLKEEWIVRR